MPSFQVLVLGSLFVSFRPSSLRSHSCSTSAFLSDFPLPIRFLSSASLPVLTTQPSASSFPFLPASASQWLPQCSALAFAPAVFPVLSSLISHAFLPGSRTRLSVCFLSPFPDSLPQLFLRCLPCAFALGLSPSNPLSFVRFSSGSGYSASVSSFPLLPRSASQWLFRVLPLCLSAS